MLFSSFFVYILVENYVEKDYINSLKGSKVGDNVTLNTTSAMGIDDNKKRRNLLAMANDTTSISKLCDINATGNAYPTCNFDEKYEDSEKPCGYENNWRGKTNWTLNTGDTETKGTGPLEGDWGSPSYLYVESSHFYLQWGDKAIVDTPFFVTDNDAGATCTLKFSFHMRGGKDMIAGMGKLRVFQRQLNCTADKQLINDTWIQLFSRHGDMGFDWNFTEVFLRKSMFATQLRFIAVIHGTTSDIAIDSIFVACNYKPPPPPIVPPFIPPKSCWQTSENAIVAFGTLILILIVYHIRNICMMSKAGGIGFHYYRFKYDRNRRYRYKPMLDYCKHVYCCKKKVKLNGMVELNGLLPDTSSASMIPSNTLQNRVLTEWSHIGCGNDTSLPIKLTIMFLQRKKRRFRRDHVARIAVWKPLQTLRTDTNLNNNRYYYRRTDRAFTTPKHNTREAKWRNEYADDFLPTFQCNHLLHCLHFSVWNANDIFISCVV